MNPSDGENGLYIRPAVFGWVGTGKGRNPRAAAPGAALGGVLAAGSVNPNAGTLGWEMPSPSGEGVPAVHGARGDSSQSRLNLGAGSLNAVAHVRLFYLVSEAERVGDCTQEDPAGPRRG